MCKRTKIHRDLSGPLPMHGSCPLFPAVASFSGSELMGRTLCWYGCGRRRLLAGLPAGLLRVRLGPGLEPAREPSQRLSCSNRPWPCNERDWIWKAARRFSVAKRLRASCDNFGRSPWLDALTHQGKAVTRRGSGRWNRAVVCRREIGAGQSRCGCRRRRRGQSGPN
jgi:hypothetical protein